MIISYLCTIRRKQSTSSNDEEGGRVARIGNNANFLVKKYESMGAIGATGDSQNAYECGNTIGTYLTQYGFDVDFAPVADVNTNPENIVIGARAFSDDPHVAAAMVVGYLQGLKDAGQCAQCDGLGYPLYHVESSVARQTARRVRLSEHHRYRCHGDGCCHQAVQ